MAATDTSALRSQLATRAEQAVAPTEERPRTIADIINAQRAEIARALPRHMDADRLARIATTVIKTTPKLLECSSTSLLGALMLCAQTGMEPGPLGHAYLVPRKIRGTMECQWMLGYKGIIELARRSGQLVSIEAREVCERDEFEFEYGLEERLLHRPAMDGDRGPLVAVWGLAKFKDGGHYFLVMSRADIEAAKARSDAAKAGSGPWFTDYAAMARKTVIRRMAPYLPLSPEQAQVLAHDESVPTGIRPNMVEEPPEAQWIDADIVHEGQPPADVDPDTGEVQAPATPPDDGPTGLIINGEPVDDEPTVPDEPMTEPQSRALHGLLRSKHNASGAARFPILSELLGREITSTKQISKAEASELIDQLQDGGAPEGDER